MKAAQVRQSFLDFFAARGHEKVASSALVPANDPTLLFTNAGMVQFKDVFTGMEARAIRRATSSQKCVRAGGKHNDLDEVGKTPRHHTFFEMLGNFSFGDYFKEDAIAWAWELLTGVWGIDPRRLIVTVFGGDTSVGIAADDEARAIWKRVTGFGDDRVLGLGMADNFWMMGETGPMGPCSEIHFMDPERKVPTSAAKEEWNGWLEIWNLVFMQYERREAGGPMHKLPAPSIDTGAGLERVTSVLQGVASNYDTDLFTPLLREAAEISGVQYGAAAGDDMSMRVIADHARTAAFLIADGVFPDKTGREYVLRRIFRRAVRHGELLGIKEPFMHRVCARVIAEMKDVYPELAERATVIHEVTLEEEKRFRATLSRGLGLLEEEFAALRAGGTVVLPGDKVFMLYDTFGFPEDLTEIIAGEQGFAVDMPGFQAALDRARERSRFDGSGGEAVAEIYKQLAGELGARSSSATTAAASTAPARSRAARRWPAHRQGRRRHQGRRDPRPDPVLRRVGRPDRRRRRADLGRRRSRAHRRRQEAGRRPVRPPGRGGGRRARGRRPGHPGGRCRPPPAHPRQPLGHPPLAPGAQAGAGRARGPEGLAGGARPAALRLLALRADHRRAEAADRGSGQRRGLRNADSVVEVLPIADARQRGAVAMFGEKYGDQVRVVRIGGESLEFCGGTHVRRTGDIGLFKILSESGIAQGVRRIEAVTSEGAMAYLRRLEGELSRAGAQLKVAPLEVSARVERLAGEARQLEREVATLKAKLAAGGARDLMSEVADVGGVKLLVVSTEVDDVRALRETGDNLKNRIGSGVIVLAGIGADKVTLLAMVTSDLTDRFHAGKLLDSVAKVMGGKAGGRPDMAQGGGKDANKVPEALARARELVQAWAQGS